MLYWVILFVLGEICVQSCSVWSIGGLAAGFLLGIKVCPLEYVTHNRTLLYISVLFFVLGGVSFGYAGQKQSICTVEDGTPVAFYGRVADVEIKQNGCQYRLAATQLNGSSIRVNILLESSEELPIDAVIRGNGIVSNFEKASNPGEFDERSYQYGKGNFLKLQDIAITSQRVPFFRIKALLYQIREGAAHIYRQLFSEEDASLACAMVLGDRTNLDVDTKQLYQRNGIAHLIAISGLHIAMLGGTLYRILRKWTGSYPVAAGMGVLFILLYGFMAGLAGATLRAVIMLIVAIGADVSGRRYDSLTAVAVALLLMLIGYPYQLNQAGFVLSYGAVVGIAVVQPVLKEWFYRLPGCLDGFVVSVSVQLVLMPVMLYFFYEMPLYGVLLNLVVVPLMSVLLFLLILAVVFGSLYLPFGNIPARLAELIFTTYRLLCQGAEQLPGHTICTGRPPVYWMVLYYGVLILFLWSGYHRSKKWQAGWIGLLLCLLALFYLPSHLLVCMFDVGQGDGIYIRTPDRQHILVDGGSSSKKKVGTYVLKNGIKYYGGANLDYVFVSHSDSDHYSGVAELLEEPTVTIRHLVLPAIANPDEAYIELVNKGKKNGCEVLYIQKGDRIQLGEVTIDCVSPQNKKYEDKNQGSMVLYLTYHQFNMLFTGDMDEMVEQEIAGGLPENIAVLKVAHHGSATASSESFLRNISFQTALISVGEGNRYGHPAEEVLKRLRHYCERIYLTKEDGGITIDSDGTGYRIHTVK